MFTVLRQTIRKRLQTKLNEVKSELQRRMHDPIPEQGKWLGAVVRGHIRYYGAPMNLAAQWTFRIPVGWLWQRALSRRSQKGRVRWDRLRRLTDRWLPLPILCHPYPLRRMGRAGNPLVRIRGGGQAPILIPTPTWNLNSAGGLVILTTELRFSGWDLIPTARAAENQIRDRRRRECLSPC